MLDMNAHGEMENIKILTTCLLPRLPFLTHSHYADTQIKLVKNTVYKVLHRAVSLAFYTISSLSSNYYYDKVSAILLSLHRGKDRPSVINVIGELRGSDIMQLVSTSKHY